MKPSLDEWLASRPTCPDCGEKLHKAGYCPGRRQIRPGALQHPTQTEKKEHTMPATMTKNPRTGTGKAAPVTVKRTKPSKSGETIDTSKAKPVGVVQEAAAKMAQEHAATTAAIKAGHLTKKEQAAQRDEDAAAASIARDDKDRHEAVLEMNDDHEAKTKGHIPPKGRAKAAAKGKGSTKAKEASVHRLTTKWASTKNRDVLVADKVKTPEGVGLLIVGRWTKKTAKGNVPFVTGEVFSLPTGKGTPTTKKVGDRMNAAASTLTHVEKIVRVKK
jgi:hypothetical protein